MKRTALLCLASVLAGLAPAQAEQLSWGSSFRAADTISSGQFFTEDTYFELGVFKNGFVPTPANIDQWAANWAPASRTEYYVPNRWYTSIFTVTNNVAPFTVGAAAYIWGFKGAEEAGEWILFRSTNWTWPAPNPQSPLPKYWNTSGATSLIVGSITPQATGSKVNMRTAAIRGGLPPSTGWKQWQEMELNGKTALTNPRDDADGDGVSNLLEFLLGTSPTSAADYPRNVAHRIGVTSEGGKDYLEVSVPRRRDRLVQFTPEVSNDLMSWTSGTNATTVVSDTAEALTVRDRTPIGEAGAQRFLRVNASPQ